MILSRGISKLVWQFMSGNFLSKVSGLIRDVTMAFLFGADAMLAAFIVAYRMANLLRRLFGEGALVAGFIPHFESLKVESEKKAFEFFQSVSTSMLMILVTITALFESAVWIVHRFFSISKDILFILDMTAIMFPSIIFICLYGVYSGVLQSYKKFFQTSIAPVVFNFTWVVVMIFSKQLEKKSAMILLSIGVLLGFILQFLFTAWQVKTIKVEGLEGKWRFGIHSNLKPLFASLLAGVIGVGATQINNACDVIFARMASLEGPAHLTYGIRIQQLPLSIFVIALSSVILPQLSRLVKLQENDEFIKTLQTALHRTFFILVPITFMCYLIGGAFVNAIYGRGGFDQHATVQTTYCLFAYASGLLPMGFVILLAPAFYAQKNYQVTTIASCISVLVNLFLNWFFVTKMHLGCQSIAYATSVASLVNMFILGGFLAKEWGSFISKQTLIEMGKITFAATFAFITQACIDYSFLKTPSLNLLIGSEILFPRTLFHQLLQFFGGVTSYLSFYLLYCYFFRVEGVTFSRLRNLLPSKNSVSN
jgi:putative peptidoglycan lipid II flippase